MASSLLNSTRLKRKSPVKQVKTIRKKASLLHSTKKSPSPQNVKKYASKTIENAGVSRRFITLIEDNSK